MAKKILMVLTSHSALGDTGKKTGFWLEEFAAPYYVFLDAGADITLASPQGGQPPLDPKSDDPGAQTDATRRFKADGAAQKTLAHTHKLAEVSAADFDAVFYPGGHGPLWDLAEDKHSIALIEQFLAGGKPVAAVGHAAAGLRNPKPAGGESGVRGQEVAFLCPCGKPSWGEDVDWRVRRQAGGEGRVPGVPRTPRGGLEGCATVSGGLRRSRRPCVGAAPRRPWAIRVPQPHPVPWPWRW